MKKATFLIIMLLIYICGTSWAHKEAKFVMSFSGKGELPGRIAEETSLAFDREDNIYILDAENYRIQKFSSVGAFLMEINPEKLESPQFKFTNPKAISVGPEGEIYLLDWKIEQISGRHRGSSTTGSDQKIFKYAPCIHKFDTNGKFIETFFIHKLAPEFKGAVPALDADGNYSLIIPQGDPERTFLFATDSKGYLYVLDEGKIYKLDQKGESINSFSVGQHKAITDMAVDDEANLYLASATIHRIIKFGPYGKLLLSFGGYGFKDGELILSQKIAISEDNSIFVADKAEYKMDYATSLTRRKYDPLPRVFIPGLLDDSIDPHKVKRTRISRVQRFDTNGNFLEKTLIRLERENPKHADLCLKELDRHGNIYFIDKEKLTFHKYVPGSAFNISALHNEIELRYEKVIYDFEIDNPDDLDDKLGPSSDWDDQYNVLEASVGLTFAYDVNENLRLRLSGTSSYIESVEKQYYRTPDFEDVQGSYNQDDKTVDKYLTNELRLDVRYVLNHNPFEYRSANFFAYISSSSNDYIVDAFDPNNKRYFDWDSLVKSFGIGLRYDLGNKFRLLFSGRRYPAADYDYYYIDELGMLYATGFRRFKLAEILLTVDGVF